MLLSHTGNEYILCKFCESALLYSGTIYFGDRSDVAEPRWWQTSVSNVNNMIYGTMTYRIYKFPNTHVIPEIYKIIGYKVSILYDLNEHAIVI